MTGRRRRPAAAGAAELALALVLVLLLGGSCSWGGSGRAVVRVYAAASLADAFTDLASRFEEREDADVELEFGASSTLAHQIEEGGPADVFASADPDHVRQVLADRSGPGSGGSGSGVSGRTFARNELVLAVPAANRAHVHRLDDLARPDLLVGLCAPEVPCGRLARALLEQAGVSASVDSEEPDVRALLGKIEEGELDAGLVYRTDVLAAGDRVEGIDLPAGLDVDGSAAITTVPGARHERTARRFVAFVLSAAGQAVLARHGFLRP